MAAFFSHRSFSADASPAAAESHAETPAVLYQERIAALRLQEAALQREHIQLGYLRLAFGIASVLMLFPPVPFIALGLLGFVLAARVHGRVLGQLAAIRRSLAYYQRGLARLADRWSELAHRSVREDTASSLYAADLDLFAPGGLFDRLCEARTSLGEDTLARWLLQPADSVAIRARQEAVTDLRPRVPLREAFAAVRGPALASLDLTALATWAEQPVITIPPLFRRVAPLLVLLTVGTVVRYALTGSPLLLAGMLLLNGVLTYRYRRGFTTLFIGADAAGRALETTAGLLHLVEHQSFSAFLLAGLQEDLRGTPGGAASAVGALSNLSAWIDGRRNYLVRILDTPLLYSLQLACAVQRWRQLHGKQLRSWLTALATVEALLSLATFSYEHPEHTLPEINTTPRLLQARGLGHPLLPAASCVRNDVTLDEHRRVLLISGSNMSGKSTLLRALGINVVLAQAGAPVCAHHLQLSPLCVAASIQVADSLLAGQSRFYAEILRLRAIVEATGGPLPVLFLLDELLAGTNSSDRVAGAAGLVRALLEKGSLGLLSTHDLSLAALAHTDAHQMRNMHFEDTVVDGELHFDYRLRDGTVERSNGLALMRMIGLDV